MFAAGKRGGRQRERLAARQVALSRKDGAHRSGSPFPTPRTGYYRSVRVRGSRDRASFSATTDQQIGFVWSIRKLHPAYNKFSLFCISFQLFNAIFAKIQQHYFRSNFYL